MLRVKEIVSVTGGELIKGNEEGFCKGVSIDSRTINQGEAFIAIEGENFNGHDFVKEALEKNARGIIFSDYLNCDFKSYDSKFFIKVEDTISAMGKLANYYREKYSPDIIAITGSVGKTTTKNFIHKILSSQYIVCKAMGTQNNEIGVPLNILKYAPICDILVLELGTNTPGEISHLAKICTPDVGIILNVGPSHLKYFKTVERVKKEKLSLLNYMKTRGCAIINKDFIKEKQLTENNFFTIAINKNSDFQANNIKFHNKGMTFNVNGEKFEVNFKNRNYIYNILASIAVASIYKMDREKLNKEISKLEVTSSRFQSKKFKHCTVLDDTYNSNPMSLKNSLLSMMEYSNPGRKVAVLGDMLELGNFSRDYHLEIGEFIANLSIDRLFLLGKLAQYIKEGSLNKGMNKDKIVCFPNLRKACEDIPNRIKKGDMILVKGSRDMKMEKVVRSIQHSEV